MSSLRLGSIAPDFEAQTTAGPIKPNWERPPVAHPNFVVRDVKLIGLSASGLDNHEKWIKDINEYGSNTVSPTEVQFPSIADAYRKISAFYDMLDVVDATNVDSKGIPSTVRTVFLIDPKKVIRLTISYPARTGRNFDEILRAIDSIQLGDMYKPYLRFARSPF
ncbi:hypothetical protein FRC17_002581 [Serendipita sp. 399]|nr:hypothetical protein FRC17_002581 [Serendipita sp. 399]